MQIASELSPTVFVVEDDDQTRGSLVAMLDVLGLAVRGFPDAGSFARFYHANMPGCLIAEVCMPRQNGLQLYESLVREGKQLPVIFMTAHADVPTAIVAMKAGAVEFLEKPFDQQTLLDAVQVALKLDTMWRKRNARFQAVDERMRRLTGRERETLTLVMAGDSNKSAAEKLFLTERAVEMRRSSIMKKLEVNSLAELCELAVTHRILEELRESTGQMPAY